MDKVGFGWAWFVSFEKGRFTKFLLENLRFRNFKKAENRVLEQTTWVKTINELMNFWNFFTVTDSTNWPICQRNQHHCSCSRQIIFLIEKKHLKTLRTFFRTSKYFFVTYTFYKNKYLKKVNNCFETTVDSLKGKLSKNLKT
jgi:hypothetical protein